MYILITLFSIYGLAFLIKESDGPGGIIAWFRNKIMQNKYVGVFFYKLLSCYFCTGMYCGAIVYLLYEKTYHWNFLFLWALAGGAICLIMDATLNKLNR